MLKGLFADIANNTTCYRTAYKQAGWQGKGSFLLADGSVFGNKEATYALPVQGRNRQAGTLVAWQQMVADTAPGNSRLIFALSVALTGPVLDLADESFAGFHLVGASSTGKSTAATLAASVWGAPLPTDQVRSWRATDNALESVAAEHSDSLLVLDEMAQIDPKIIEATVYMLGNGSGKARANRDGSARESRSWRLSVLSTGEHTAGDAIRTTGKRHTAGGVDVRMINIPADPGAGKGLFEHTHGLPAAEFAGSIVRNCQEMHGTAGREWLTKLAMLRQTDDDEAPVRDMIRDDIASFLAVARQGQVDGQIERVARKFALVAAAGELGITLDLLLLDPGSARDASLRCFRDWLAERGASDRSKEVLDLIERVRAHCETHRAQFLDLDVNEDRRDRIYGAQSGYIRDGEFCFLSSAFKEVAAPMGQQAAAKVLHDAGLLDGKPANKYRGSVRHGETKHHCYVVRGSITDDRSEN